MKLKVVRNVYLGDGSRLERFVIDVRLDALDDHVRNVILVELEQTVKELLWFGQQEFTRFPEIIPLLARLTPHITYISLWSLPEGGCSLSVV